PRSSTSSIGGRGRSPETLTLSAFPPPSRISRNPDSQWAVDGLLEESGEDPSPYMDLRRKRDAAAVSAALSRLLPTTDATSPGKMMDRLAGIRARKGGLLPEDREMTQVLLRLVDEIKPLLVAAKKAGLNVPEIRRVVADATSGREGDLTYRVRVVEQLKDTLESSLVEHIAQDLQSVLVDIEHTKVATQQVHAAELTAAEGVALLDTGNYSAAIDRVARARETIGTSLANVGLPPAEGESGNSAPLSIVPLVGPSIVACLYVAIGAILLARSSRCVRIRAPMLLREHRFPVAASHSPFQQPKTIGKSSSVYSARQGTPAFRWCPDSLPKSPAVPLVPHRMFRGKRASRRR